MPNLTSRNATRAAHTLMDELTQEFGQIVARIRDHWNDVPVRDLASDTFAVIEAAEQTVDRTANDLLKGVCGRSNWSEALSEYELAWSRVFDSLGDRRN